MSNFSRSYRKKDSNSKEATHYATFYDMGRNFLINFGEIGEVPEMTVSEKAFAEFLESEKFEEVDEKS